MSARNTLSRTAPYRFVDQRVVSWLFPLEDQPEGAVLQGRDAERALAERPATDVIGVRASGPAPGDVRGRPLTAVPLSAVPAAHRDRVRDAVATPPEDPILVFGEGARPGAARSTAESVAD